MEPDVAHINDERFPMQECGHRGILSVHLSNEGKGQCTNCANVMRFGLVY